MEATFLMWSAAASSQERREGAGGGGGVYLSQQTAAVVVTPESAGEVSPRRRAAKKKKAAGGQKKPPQRGLGVEKLERLRLQERWRMMTEIEPPLADQQIQSSTGTTAAGGIHGDDDRQQMLARCQAPHSPFVQQCGGSLRLSFPPYGGQHQAAVGGRLPLAKVVAIPAPVSYGGAAGDSCFLQRHRLLGNRGMLFASASSVANQEDSEGDRMRPTTGVAGVQADRQSLELPSSSQSLQRSEQCDVCSGEEKFRTNEIGGGSAEGKKPHNPSPAAADLAAVASSEEIGDVKGGSAEIKVYEFFPCSSSSSPIERRTADGEVPSSISARSSRHLHLDLSLKLSSQ